MKEWDPHQRVLNSRRAARRALLYACFFWLLSVSSLHSLDPNKHVSQYMHTSWRIQDGSLPSGMFSITQTTDGFLWFLSLSGDVYRFDGVRFVPWRLPAEVSKRPLGQVFADHDEGLWLDSLELFHLKNGVVASHFNLMGLHGFHGLSKGPDGSLWLGLRDSGTPLCNVTDRAANCFGKADGVPISSINTVLADGSGGFWLGGETALVHWHAAVSENYNLANGEIFSLARGPDGTVWVGVRGDGTGYGLAQVRNGAVRPFVTPTFDGSKISVTTVYFDRDGNLWVGTDAQGVFRIHGNDVEHYGQTDGLSGNSVWDFFEDREGIVWAGTTSGVDSFRDLRVTTFSAVQGLGKDLPAGILASRDGTVWVSNAGSLDRIKNGIVSSIRRADGLPGDQVAATLEDHAGNLWVGVDDHLYLFKNGRFRRLPEPHHQPLGMIVGMTEDIDGNIWAECASHPRKLVRIRDFQVREVFTPSQVPDGHNLAPSASGGIWVETLSGDLLLLRNGAVETKVSLGPRSSPMHRQVVPQPDGSVLVGTETGLVGWRGGKVQRMTTSNGLPCDFVITFTQDKEKRWWLYTRCGVVEFSDSELQRWWVDSSAIVHNRLYDTLDGARPNNGSFNEAATTPDGHVWFCSGVVVQMLNPSILSQQELKAQTYIESITVDRKEFAAAGNLKVSPHPRELQVDYTSPTFTIPQKVKFRYRLDPYDHDWHEAGTRRQAFYTDLPPGKYSFRVMAANSDGVWNDSPARLDFSVAPAYYQTIWFQTLCAGVFLAFLWTLHQLRLRQQARQFNMTLEARVGERIRIARDLHDTLLQSFLGVLPRFQAAIYKLPESAVAARETLEAAVEQASQAVTEGRDAVKGLRASTVEKNDLAMAIRELAEELASADSSQSAPAFQVAVQGSPRDLHPILRDDVYRIAAEALRNAFRHAQAHQIEVELRYDEKDFTLHIRDNGRGINQEILSGDGREGHFGLHGMRERAKLVGGELAIWTEVDSGTEIELSIPASRAYSKSGRRFWLFEKLSKNTNEKEKIVS